MSGAAAAGAAAAGGAVITVALAYALYAFAKIWLVPAASAAVVALVFAAAFGIGAAVMAGRARGGHGKAGGKTAKHLKHAHEEPRTLLERAMDTARERPVVAAAGALAAGLLALRNPALVATVIGLINQPPRPRRD